jgi:cobaltochelatase CobN
MHRIAATPGGWNPDTEGVIFVEQTPAPIIFLTAADTDIQTLAVTLGQLPSDFPPIRTTNLLNLQQQLSIDTYAEDILQKAQVIIVRLLGGRSYWSYGLEVLQELVENNNIQLILLPGDDRPDPDLMSHSTVPLQVVNQVWHYLIEGGVENMTQMLLFLGQVCLGKHYQSHPPITVPKVGIYSTQNYSMNTEYPRVGLLFYRAHYLCGNIQPIEALCRALIECNLQPVPVFVSSLRDRDIQAEVIERLQPIELLLNTTSFAINDITASDTNQSPLFHLNVPILQVILSGGTQEQWQESFQGLSPRDVAMNIALPEVDGRVISRVISFKATQNWNPHLETDVIGYIPVQDRVNFVAELTANWVKLRQKLPSQRKVALILANYPNKDGRLANGVGLDTPASCVEILQALQQQEYEIDQIPSSGDELIQKLTTGVTNDPEGHDFRPVYQKLSHQKFQQYFTTLPQVVQNQIKQRWQYELKTDDFAISGLQLGNIFVGIQPSRGYDKDPSLN